MNKFKLFGKLKRKFEMSECNWSSAFFFYKYDRTSQEHAKFEKCERVIHFL